MAVWRSYFAYMNPCNWFSSSWSFWESFWLCRVTMTSSSSLQVLFGRPARTLGQHSNGGTVTIPIFLPPFSWISFLKIKKEELKIWRWKGTDDLLFDYHERIGQVSDHPSDVLVMCIRVKNTLVVAGGAQIVVASAAEQVDGIGQKLFSFRIA